MSFMGDFGHRLSQGWHSIDNPNTLGIIGDVAGAAIGGPWGAALGGFLGGELGGGSARHSLGLGALGYGGAALAGYLGGASSSASGATGGFFGAGGGLSNLVGGFGAGAGAGAGWGATNYMGLMGLGTGIKSYLEGEQLRHSAASADPYAAARAQYISEMQALEANPSSIVNTPGYEAAMTGLQRTLAAQGYTGSGKAATDIASLSGSMYAQRMQQLGALASMGNPAAPAQVSAAGIGAEAQGLEQMGLGMYLAFL
jgi:hypothetical protein